MKELLSAVYLGFLTLVFAAYMIYQIESTKNETKFKVCILPYRLQIFGLQENFLTNK